MRLLLLTLCLFCSVASLMAQYKVVLQEDATKYEFHTFHDFDADGRIEFLLTTFQNHQDSTLNLNNAHSEISIFSRRENQNFELISSWGTLPFVGHQLYTDGMRAKSDYLYDFDQDGAIDLLVPFGNWYSCKHNAIRIYWGHKSLPYFTKKDYAEILLKQPTACVLPFVLDFNNDGWMDILIENVINKNIKYANANLDLAYQHVGKRQFKMVRPSLQMGRDLTYIGEDLDLDGKDDLWITQNDWFSDNYNLYFAKGDGSPLFPNIRKLKAVPCIDRFGTHLYFTQRKVSFLTQTHSGECNYYPTKFRTYQYNTTTKDFDIYTTNVKTGHRVLHMLDMNDDGSDDAILWQKTDSTHRALKVFYNTGTGAFGAERQKTLMVADTSYTFLGVIRENGKYLLPVILSRVDDLEAKRGHVNADSLIVYEVNAAGLPVQLAYRLPTTSKMKFIWASSLLGLLMLFIALTRFWRMYKNQSAQQDIESNYIKDELEETKKESISDSWMKLEQKLSPDDEERKSVILQALQTLIQINPQPTVHDLVNEVPYGRKNLERFIKRIFGTTPKKLLDKAKMEQITKK